jgi:hypothetical protein
MKAITIQEGATLRLILVPENSVEEHIMELFRAAEGNQTKVIPIDTKEVERVLNPYTNGDGARNGSKKAVLLELVVPTFPKTSGGEK